MSDRYQVEKFEFSHKRTHNGKDVSAIWKVIDSHAPKEQLARIVEIFETENEAVELASIMNKDWDIFNNR